MILLCGAGPAVLPRLPGTDPTHAALLAPGTRARVLTLTGGRTLVIPEGSREAMVRGGTRVVSSRRVTFWLGTDRYGRDLLRELLEGGRISLAIAASSLLLALLLGLGTGIAAGSSSPLVDGMLMRLVDALLAFPVLFLMILVVAVFRPSVPMLVAVLGATSWMGLARLVRGQILSLRSMPFVLAARAAGSPWHRIWRLHYLPHLTGPVAQDAALRMGDLVLAEATLSYLGLGVPPSIPTWGSLVAQGHKAMLDGWWLATFPGLAIALLVIALALIGDGLHELVRRAG
jgi:peptide/nickel transport system permease protein